LAKQGGKDALIYHGWNTTFDYATYRATQLAYDLGVAGPVILFSWPSKGSLTAYSLDAERVVSSTSEFQSLLSLTRKAVGPRSNVHVIAHGTGIKPVLEVQNFSTTRSDQLAAVGEIIAAAPDMSSDEFDLRCAAIKPAVRGITVYGSAFDRALQASQQLNMTPRAGWIGSDGPTVGACADVIDVGSLAGDFDVGHTVGLSAAVALEDVRRLIRTGMRPPQVRSARLVAVQAGRGTTYWRLAK